MTLLFLIIPLFAAVVAGAVGSVQVRWARPVATGLLWLGWVPALWMHSSVVSGTGPVPWSAPWMPQFGLEWGFGLDGLNSAPVLLTALLAPLVLLMWTSVEKTSAVVLVSLEIAFLQGCFLSSNFLQWFLFYELTLVPVFLLIKFFGDSDRDAAALRFFVFTVLGSLPMLAAFLWIFSKAGSFDFARLSELSATGELAKWIEPYGNLAFWCVLIGLAVKMPLLPLHSWMPAAYRSAPTPVTVLMTALMSKLGVYGLVRLVVPVFPEQLAQHSSLLTGVAVVTVLYGALAALRQSDMKMVLVYSSLSHVAYCAVAVFAIGAGTGIATMVAEREAALQGALLQVFNHGMTAAALFVIWEQIWGSAGTRRLEDFGGLRTRMPRMALLAGCAIFASIGLPGLNGFVSEFLVFKGAFPLQPGWISLAGVALVLTALYLLRLYHGVFWGPLSGQSSEVKPAGFETSLAAMVLLFFCVIAGVAPAWVANPIAVSVGQLLALHP